jgi:hypothetical protein
VNKKKQKNFAYCGPLRIRANARRTESLFASFSSEKEALAYLKPSKSQPAPAQATSPPGAWGF